MPITIPFIKPKFPEPEDLMKDLKRINKNNYFSNNGPFYYEFKEALEKYLGQGITATIVSNATLGLMLAIQSCMCKPSSVKNILLYPHLLLRPDR